MGIYRKIPGILYLKVQNTGDLIMLKLQSNNGVER